MKELELTMRNLRSLVVTISNGSPEVDNERKINNNNSHNNNNSNYNNNYTDNDDNHHLIERRQIDRSSFSCPSLEGTCARREAKEKA